jgi:hypothetical protein
MLVVDIRDTSLYEMLVVDIRDTSLHEMLVVDIRDTSLLVVYRGVTNIYH